MAHKVLGLLIHAAKGFHDVGFHCASTLKDSIDLKEFQRIPSAAVNLSFAAELFLKAVYLIKSKPVRGHALLKLFDSLDDETREEIESYYIDNLENDPDKKLLSGYQMIVSKTTQQKTNDPTNKSVDLHDFLQRHNQTFEKWRYIHEVEDSGYLYHADFQLLHCFIVALIKYVNNYSNLNDFTLSKVEGV